MRLIRLSFNACRIVYSPYSHSWYGNNWSGTRCIYNLSSLVRYDVYIFLCSLLISIHMWNPKPGLTVCADGYLVRRLIVHPLRE